MFNQSKPVAINFQTSVHQSPFDMAQTSSPSPQTPPVAAPVAMPVTPPNPEPEAHPEVIPAPTRMPAIAPELFSPEEALVMGIARKDLYRGYRHFIPRPPRAETAREKLMLSLAMHFFYAHEMNLMLDLEPNNQRYFELFKQHQAAGQKLVEQYEAEYGPLSLSGMTNMPWSWLNGPWPWE